jgi:uncharacterized membrane protein
MLKPTQDVRETLIGISFPDAYRAQEFTTAVSGLVAREVLVLKDVVTIFSNDKGRTVVRETIDPQPVRSAVSGAMWAGLLGLVIAGPPGWLAGAAVGASVAATTAKIVDLGVPDEWVEWFREALLPGRATVVLLVSHLDRDGLVNELKRFQGARLVHTNLDDATLDRIHVALMKPTADPNTDPATQEGMK